MKACSLPLPRLPSCWQGPSLPLCPCPTAELGAPPKPCSSGPSPSHRAMGGLLFMAVKALTPYCAALSGWIQHRALLCRPQLFCAWVGWLGGSGSGHIFQICLDGPTVSLRCVFLCLLLSKSSVCALTLCPTNKYRLWVLMYNVLYAFEPVFVFSSVYSKKYNWDLDIYPGS